MRRYDVSRAKLDDRLVQGKAKPGAELDARLDLVLRLNTGTTAAQSLPIPKAEVAPIPML